MSNTCYYTWNLDVVKFIHHYFKMEVHLDVVYCPENLDILVEAST